MWKFFIGIVVVVALAVGVGSLPLGQPCAACNRATTLVMGWKFRAAPRPGRGHIYTYHRPCFETPRALEERVKALINDIQNDMSQSDRGGF